MTDHLKPVSIHNVHGYSIETAPTADTPLPLQAAMPYLTTADFSALVTWVQLQGLTSFYNDPDNLRKRLETDRARALVDWLLKEPGEAPSELAADVAWIRWQAGLEGSSAA